MRGYFSKKRLIFKSHPYAVDARLCVGALNGCYVQGFTNASARSLTESRGINQIYQINCQLENLLPPLLLNSD